MLPILQSPPLKVPITCFTGAHKSPCEECPVKNVCTQACNKKCSQRSCTRDCNNCGGSKIEERGFSGVPAVCAKAPMLELYTDEVRNEHYEFAEHKRIKLKAKAITVVNGSAGQIQKWYPDDTAAVAINFRHAWSPEGRGWRSRDMRDYLHIPTGTKLILLTATLDDELEKAWAYGFHNEDYKAVGFDYWQALEFSLYDDMSNSNNLWTSYRNLFVQSASKAHFTHLPPYSLKMSRVAARVWRDASRAAPNLLINFQCGRLASRDDRASFVRVLARLKKWMELVDRPMTVWFNGVVSSETAFNVALNLPGVDVYFLSMAPWLFANKGNEFTERGTSRRATIPRSELLLLNQQRYVKLIETTLRRAESHRQQMKNP